jgi:hypothetical protein
MKQIPRKSWNNYIKRLSQIDKTAGDKMRAFIGVNGFPETYEQTQTLIRYGNGLVMKYGEASSALACEMYDALSALEGASVPPAEPAPLPQYGEVAKAINGTVKLANAEIVAGAVERLVKLPGADTMIQNAKRDNAEYAWIPNGDTCAFCLTLASRGWQNASKAILDGGHAEHIHAHCDCTFAIRHNSDTTVQGYDPDKYLEMYENADTSSAGFDPDRPKGQQWQSVSTAKINGMRREAYAKNKAKINAQKRSAYQKRKELNSSKAEEIKVN